MFTCKVCNEKFDYPEFGPCKKQPGNHRVELKTYIHGGSATIQNVRDRRRFSPNVFLKADTEGISAGGQITHTAPVVVQFADARYSTDNPEEQFYLERFPGGQIHWGEAGESVWRANQLTEAQQIEVAKAELADTQRQIREQNDLLSSIKAQKGAKA